MNKKRVISSIKLLRGTIRVSEWRPRNYRKQDREKPGEGINLKLGWCADVRQRVENVGRGVHCAVNQ